MRVWVFAVLTVGIMLSVATVPIVEQLDSASSNEYWTYTINQNGTISGNYTAIGPGSSYTGKYPADGETHAKYAGSWGFDDAGYGPFGSFYAAFDPAQDNKMICHLDPDNLKLSVDGKIDIAGQGYNVMWCLPTVYWKANEMAGTLTLTNDPDAGGTAYAHTIDGMTYQYLAIGVYEASSKKVNDQDILTSESGGSNILTNQKREVFRDYANNQMVNTTGEGTDGCAMLWNFYQYELYKYCALAVMGGWDSQSIAGNGSVIGSDPYYKTPGLLDTSGPYAGTIGKNDSYYKDSVKVFVENVWGSVHDFVDGIVFKDRQYIIDQSSDPKNATEEGDYITVLTETLPTTGYGSSPSTKAEIWGMPTASSGSSTSGLYDYMYSDTGTQCLIVGGFSSTNKNDVPYFGLSCMASNSGGLDRVGKIVGGRLAFVFVSDPEVTYDHSDLEVLLKEYGYSEDLMAKLPDGPKGKWNYDQLDDVAGFRHVGWKVKVGDEEVVMGPTAKFASRLPHDAISLWSRMPTVTFDHGNLTDIVGKTADGVSGLDASMFIEQNAHYPQLPDTAGYWHIGWDIEGTIVDTTASLLKDTTHTAKSLWAKISDSRPIPIIPDEEDDPIEVVVKKDSEPWLGKNSKTVLVVAIIVAIIAELAVLCISRRR